MHGKLAKYLESGCFIWKGKWPVKADKFCCSLTCSAHNNEGLTLKHICLLYLPVNTTSYMQPLDQGIIYCLKNAYKKCVVHFLLQEIGRNVPMTGIKK
jgi:hypothetical protein